MTSNLQLLRQIQDAAMTAGTPVADSLRRCKVLAVRAGAQDLASWVDHELNGYPVDAAVPDYRIVMGNAKGTFFGPFGSGIKNANLPAGNLPKEYRDWARRATLRQPLATLEEFATAKGKGEPVVQWPADLIAKVQQKFYEGMTLQAAWLELSREAFVTAVESVRNRILNFALELETRLEREDDPTPEREKVAQVFHTQIFGNVGNLAQAGRDATQTVGATLGDVASLLSELRSLKVSDADVTSLRAAMVEDGEGPRKTLGPHVGEWIGAFITKAAKGAGTVALTTATTVIPKLIARHYGIGDQV